MKSVLSAAALLLGSVSAKAEWNYLTLGADWPTLEKDACTNPKNQSPIDLVSDPALDKYPRVSGDEFTKNYNNQAAVKNGFNGHTTQLNFDNKNGAMSFTSQVSA